MPAKPDVGRSEESDASAAWFSRSMAATPSPAGRIGRIPFIVRIDAPAGGPTPPRRGPEQASFGA
jgi:hypothetical protein